MSEPEIARRCKHCGVSLRQNAMFCPQCGNPIQEAAATTTVRDVADTIIDTAPTQALNSVSHTPAHKAPEDGVRGRVETLRVVIDQAAYDPSLRFILVAAVFFLIFLVLLILSKVLE